MPAPNLHIICVSNDRTLFDRYINSNPHLQRHAIHLYDNSQQNIPIPVRYNHFINTQMEPDSWMIFMHQDMDFKEDPAKRLIGLPTNTIYGPTGALLETEGWFLALSGRKLSELSASAGRVREHRHYGRIGCLPHISKDSHCGLLVGQPTTVQTLDCCCLMVHSDLVRKYDLRFDERLEWHLYAEDFCLTSRRRHGIKTKVIQLECGHYGQGGKDESFYRYLEPFLEKHRNASFSTTVGVKPGERTTQSIKQTSRWSIIFPTPPCSKN